jgi:hypothetical protein
MLRSKSLVSLAAGGWLALLGAALAQPAAEEADAARDLTIGQRPIYQFVQQHQAQQAQRPASERIPVEAWADRPDATYRIGEPVTLHIRPRRDAHITVLNIGTSGRATVLFPNAVQREARVRAGQTLILGGPGAPYSIVPQGPAGVELVQVIASARPLTLAELTRLSQAPQGASPFVSLGRSGEEVARDLAVQVTGTQAASQGPAGMATLLLRVNAAQASAAPAAQPASTPALLQLLQQLGVPAAQLPVVAPTPATTPTLGGIAQAVSLPAGFLAPTLVIRTDRAVYGPQDAVQITVAALADCRLTLLSIGPTGQVAPLLPNPAQPETLLRAGQVLVVPPPGSGVAIRPRGSAGMETIVGLCAQREGEAASEGVSVMAQRDLGAVVTSVTTPPAPNVSVATGAAVYFVRP